MRSALFSPALGRKRERHTQEDVLLRRQCETHDEREQISLGVKERDKRVEDAH